MIIKRERPEKCPPTLAAKIRRIVFPTTPEEWRDSAAVIWRIGIISAAVTVVLASIGA